MAQSRFFLRTIFGGVMIFSNMIYAKDIIIGTSIHYPPFVYQGSHQTLSGFDIELANKICKQINANCKFKSMKFSKLLPSLEKGKIDLALSALTITHERLKKAYFSNSYLKSTGQFLVKTKDVKTKSFSLSSKRIGVEKGSVFENYLQKLKPRHATIIVKSNVDELVTGLTNNNLDVVVTDSPTVNWWVLNSGNQLSAIGKKFNIGLGIGIALGKSKKPLLEEINHALKLVQQDQGFMKMKKAYFRRSK